ncbi:MAG: penicillin-binding protein 2 [Acidimicrobiia bacterium]
MTQRMESPRLRLGVLGVVAIALFVALFARLWYLQVMSSESFTEAAEANRLRVVQVEAPRGRILDRDGTVIVDNRVSIVVTVDRVRFADLEDGERRRMLTRLAEELTRYGTPVTPQQLQDRVDDVRYSRYAPVPVAEDVTEELKIYVEENAQDFPAVAVERVAVRRYPFGTRAAHVIGYVGEINDEELAERESKPKTYIRGDQIGKTGIERIYEDDLRGMPGQTVYEVDAKGDPVRILEDLSTPPIPGDDVWLTIDIETQSLAEDLLAQALADARSRPVRGVPTRGNAGAVVVTDPRDGDVIAMASYPVFDPGSFVNGVSSSEFEYLTSDATDKPIFNRAIQGEYAPGSTFKLFSGMAALEAGLRTPEQTILDEGRFTLSECSGRCSWQNAGSKAYGAVDLRRAMTVSSDVYFYSIGADFWRARGALGDEAMQDVVRRFGFGQETGVSLPSEQDGRIPTPRQRAQQHQDNPTAFPNGEWYTGDNVNMAIGQGDVAVTPLQLVNAYASFANGGTRFAPNIVTRITRGGAPDQVKRSFEPRINGRFEMAPAFRSAMLDGLLGVTTAEGGTARTTFEGFPNETYPIAGKTGTAQVNGKADTALFTAFGPAPAPEYAVAVVLEESGYGGISAAPVARALFDVFAGVLPMPTIEPGGTLVSPSPSGAEEGAPLVPLSPALRLGQIASGGSD